MSFVYLLHFSEQYPGGQRPQHYLGVAQDIEARMREHVAGSSKSRLTRACKEKGIQFMLARTWSFDTSREAFQHERKLKKKKRNYNYLCPLCK